MRTSPDAMRSSALPWSRPTSWTKVPAARAIWPPLPGFSSTLCTIVPTGMLFSGIALPGFTSTRSPETTTSPAFRRCGARM